MEKKKKLKIKIYIVVGILIATINFINIIDINAPIDILKQDDTINDLKIPKLSSLWEVNYIHIDNNWSDAADNLNWVQGGDGSSSDPYIIENVKINAQATGNGILIENSIDHFIIRNCIIYNSGNSGLDAGINLVNVRNGQIINNNCSLNQYGIFLYLNCINNQVLKNTINNNTHSGMYIHRCDSNTVTGNTVEFNANFGIWLWHSHGNTIEKNDANKNDKNGIFLQFSNSSNIIGNELSENINENGIKLDNSNNNLLENNTMNKNKLRGIYLDGTEGCHYNVIDGNVAIENSWDGITVLKSDNNWFKNNIVANSHFNGIYIADSHYNVFDGTIGINNGHNAICLVDCNNSIVKNTFGKNNSHNGIYLRDSNETLISGNELIESRYNGITLDDTCIKNSIENNIVYNNSEDGISIIDDSNNNTVTGNIIKNNILYGVTLHPATSDNLFYENFFIENSKHTYDDTTNANYWNSSAIGNYWDNYTGIDSNGDGIGESHHLVSPIGSLIYDYLPICDNKTPVIIVDSPSNNAIFGYNAPTFNITVIDDYPFSMWYTIDGGSTNITFTGLSGVINQTVWASAPDGLITITFYAMDKPGNIGFTEVDLSKDTTNPQIFILNPVENQEFGETAPSFNVSINEDNLDSTWYTIDGGSTNIIFTGLSGVINQTVWASAPDGLITITFYAMDKPGNIGFTEVNLSKDVLNPKIYILNPVENQEFGETAPSFYVSINEDNLNSTWYTIDGGNTNITFTGLSGVINQTVWASAPDGLITITFYANDTHRNLGFNSTIIIKNIPESKQNDYDFLIGTLIGILIGAGISSFALVIVIVLILKKKSS